MQEALASIFFSLVAFGAVAVVLLSIADNLPQIASALGLYPAAECRDGHQARVRRGSRPYPRVRPTPLRMRAAA